MSSGACYSPKIREDLIPVLFRLALAEQKPMTRVLDQILREGLQVRGLIDQEQASYGGKAITGFDREDKEST